MVHLLCGAKIGDMECGIRIRHGHESRYRTETQSKQPLRADQDIKIAGGKRTTERSRIGRTADRLAVHTTHTRLRKHPMNRFLDPFRA
jgi:hypothetical protein